jgi:hypothetical protein
MTFQITEAGADSEGHKVYTLFAETLPVFDAKNYDALLS